MVSFYIYFHLHIFTPLQNSWNTSEYSESLYNDTTSILELYILLQDSLSQSEATEPSRTVVLLSSNSPSESGNTLFGMRSQHALAATQLLAQGWRLWVAKNNFLWVVSTHRESYKVLGSFRNPCESPEGLSDDSQWSLTFPLFPYNLCINTRHCLHQ